MDDLSVECWLRDMNDTERKALKIAEEMLGSLFDLQKCNGFLNWRNNHKIMNEYNGFKHKNSSIESMRNYNRKWEWYDKNAVFVIFTEYIPYTNEETNPIHYDCCYEGNAEFNTWLETYNLQFEWYNECLGIVYVNK